MGLVFLRRDEQHLGRREAAANPWTWAPGVVAAADPGGDGRSPRDGERVLEGGGDRDPGVGSLGATAPKTGQRDVHRVGGPGTGLLTNGLGYVLLFLW